MCMGMCMGICMGMFVSMSMGMCMDMCMDMCTHRCIDMRIGISMKIFTDTATHFRTLTRTHAHTYVDTHVRAHLVSVDDMHSYTWPHSLSLTSHRHLQAMCISQVAAMRYCSFFPCPFSFAVLFLLLLGHYGCCCQYSYDRCHCRRLPLLSTDTVTIGDKYTHDSNVWSTHPGRR